MAKMIDALPTPVVKQIRGGSVTLTHKAYGFRVIPWDRPRVKSFSVLGVMENGQFHAYPGTEQPANWKPVDIQAVNWDNTLSQVITQHEVIVNRAPSGA